MGVNCAIIGTRLKVDDCGRKTCMYYQEGSCIESQLRGLPPVDSKARAAEVIRIFSISRTDLEESVREVKDAQILRQFCLYLLGKDLQELTPNDVDKIKKAKVSYSGWTGCRTQKPKFESLVYLLEESILRRLC